VNGPVFSRGRRRGPAAGLGSAGRARPIQCTARPAPRSGRAERLRDEL